MKFGLFSIFRCLNKYNKEFVTGSPWKYCSDYKKKNYYFSKAELLPNASHPNKDAHRN